MVRYSVVIFSTDMFQNLLISIILCSATVSGICWSLQVLILIIVLITK